MNFYDQENQDATRHSWNVLPSFSQHVVPISCVYSPNKDLENLGLVEYEAVKCRTCSAVLNPYCQVDFKLKLWVCNFCQTKMAFPTHYAEYISEQNLPAEIMPAYTTIEYIDSRNQMPNIFLFVVDTCVSLEELNSVKDSVQQSLNLLPPETYVGLITFGKFVFVHELGFDDCPKSFAFSGTKEYTTPQLQEQLAIFQKVNNQNQNLIYSKFLVSLQDCEFQLNTILDDLQPDSWFTKSDERQLRATGSAINIATCLLESSPVQGGRMFCFLGGACTYGPGKIVNPSFCENLRSFHDIQKETKNAQHFKPATKFYQQVTNKCIKNQMTINIFAFTLDQFGLAEMKCLVENTGGYIVMHESFDSNNFRESYKKLFEKDQIGDQKTGCMAKLQVFVSKELQVNGLVGPGTSLKKGGSMVSETEVGKGMTTQWYLGQVDKCTTVALFYQVAKNHPVPLHNRVAYFQYQTTYKHSTGKIHTRITTVAKKFSKENGLEEVSSGFDQEAACTCMSRLAVLKTESEDQQEVLKWVDRNLIRLVSKFSYYRTENVQSFNLFEPFQLYPQFMYHFRRSHFIQHFGISPDESQYYKQTLLRENTTNSLVMIQPALLQYTWDNPNPQPIHLDLQALKPNVVLLLDSYFHVIIWHGDHIKKWQDQGYHLKEDYQSFRDLLAAPVEDSKMILEDRFPSPNYYICHQGSGQERYLKSKVDPGQPNNNPNAETSNYITDDASLKVFNDYLVKLVVQTPK